MPIIRFTFILLLALAFPACSHTNELKHHTLHTKTVEYKHTLSGDAARWTTSQLEDDLLESDAAGSHVVGATVFTKLSVYAKPEQMVARISSAMGEAVSTFFKITTKNGGGSDYIFETDLSDYRLNCSEEGLWVEGSVHCRLLERNSGKIVWDDCSYKKVYWTRIKLASDQAQVEGVSCRELAGMSEDEIRKGLDRIAGSIAYSMIETMRGDVEELTD